MTELKFEPRDKEYFESWAEGSIASDISKLDGLRMYFDFNPWPVEIGDDFNATIGDFTLTLTSNGEDRLSLQVIMNYGECVSLRDYLTLLIEEHNHIHKAHLSTPY